MNFNFFRFSKKKTDESYASSSDSSDYDEIDEVEPVVDDKENEKALAAYEEKIGSKSTILTLNYLTQNITGLSPPCPKKQRLDDSNEAEISEEGRSGTAASEMKKGVRL